VAPWDDHPNQAGHKLIAERLYPKLLEVLRSVPPPSTNVATTGR
jgi:hypothetical protein